MAPPRRFIQRRNAPQKLPSFRAITRDKASESEDIGSTPPSKRQRVDAPEEQYDDNSDSHVFESSGFNDDDDEDDDFDEGDFDAGGDFKDEGIVCASLLLQLTYTDITYNRMLAGLSRHFKV
jgi:hypothetical protein